MDHNFTPLDMLKIIGKQETPPVSTPSAFESKFNTILLILFTITLLVLCIIMFILIQKKLQKTAYYQSVYHALPV